MKLLKKTEFCQHCGDELSEDEISDLKTKLCAFCEHMHYEALEIHAQKQKSKQNKDVTIIL